ncbi:MAG: TonB-dependent receptor [Bacteroidota bacterium]
MQNTKIILFFLCAFVLQQTAKAQEDLPSEEVEVIKDFDARLIETEKIEITPTLPKATNTDKTQVYTIPSRSLQVEYLPPKIRPLAMKRDKLPTQYDGFLKAGYGVPASPYVEASYHTFQENLKLGGRFKHHSANFQNVENQRFATNEAEVKGAYYRDEGFAFGGNLGYTSDQVHYFGYNQNIDTDSLSVNREQVKQTFNTFKLGGTFFNGERTQGDINYNAGFNFYNTKDNFATSEVGFDAQFGVTKWIADRHALNVGLKTDITTFKNGDRGNADSLKQKLNNFYLTPNFTYHADAFKIKVGANLVAVDGAFNFFPDIEASANIVGNKFTVFAGAEGSLKKNTMRSITYYNPFVKTFGSLEIRNTDYNHFYGGIRGAFGNFNYKGQVGYKNVKNLALFLTDWEDFITTDFGQVSLNRTEVLYDDGNVFNIQGSLTAPLFSGFELGGTVSVNAYDMDVQEKAWHLPATEFNVNAKYKMLEDRLLLNGELFVANGVPYLTADGMTDNLNALLDVSAGAEYILTDNFSAFVNINNLLDNNRERWASYETYGLNVLFGIQGRF